MLLERQALPVLVVRPALEVLQARLVLVLPVLLERLVLLVLPVLVV